MPDYPGLKTLPLVYVTNYEYQEAYVPQHCVAKVNPATFSYTTLATYTLLQLTLQAPDLTPQSS